MSWQDDEIVGGSWQNDPVVSKPKAEVSGPMQAMGVAAGRSMDRLASGLRQVTPAPIRNALDKVDQFMGVESPSIDPQTVQNATDAYEPMQKQHPVAAFVGEAAPTLAARNPIGAAVMGGLEYGTPAERATRAGLNYAGSKAGEYVGGKIAGAMANKAESTTASLATQKAHNAARDATIREAQQAGYVIPPTQVNPQNPGMLNRLLEGASGKIQTAQAAAIKNQEVTNSLAKKALLLPDDVPLSRESIGAVRSAAGEVYKAVKGFGPMQADDEFRAGINGLTGEYRNLVAEFPSQNNTAINALLKDLSRDNFNSSTMVEFVKRLRHDGFKNLAAMEPEKKALGQVQIGAQGQLEDLLERRLVAAGDQGALDVFRKARALIAKSYTVENALEESTGKVVASKIGKEFSKGRPLTGELASIGKTAEAFPRALQNVNSSMPGLSPLDAMFGTGAGIASGNALFAGIPLARPAIRAGLLSQPYQQAMVGPSKYTQTAMDKMIAKVGDNPDLMKRLGGLLGLSGERAGLQAYR